MSALENFFDKNEINLQEACFVSMDTTNVGEKWTKKTFKA